MKRAPLLLSEARQLLEPGPVVLLGAAHKGAGNVMTMVATCNFFVLEVVAAWIDRSRKDARTMHHRGGGAFMAAAPTAKLPSRMRQAVGLFDAFKSMEQR